MLPPYGPTGTGTVTNVTGTAPISVANGTSTPAVSLDALGVSTAKLADGAATAAKIGTSAVTAAKLAAAQKRRYFVLGRNGAGAVTLTGALVGDKLDGAVNLAAGPGANLDRTTAFEATITVVNQIQQTSASDLSGEAIQFDLIRSGS